MEENLNLAQICTEISGNLLDSINLLEILDNLADGDSKIDTIIDYLQQNITSAFKNIEKCRKIIYILD